MDGRGIREYVTVSVVLAAILFLFFRHALSPDRVLSPADRLFATPFFAEVAPPGFSEPANSLLFDQVYQFTPWRYFAWQSLRNGFVPVWNPYSYCGSPLVATMQAAVFYPINLLLTVLPFPLTFVWSALLRLWVAGMSTYLLMRRYTVEPVPALIAAVSFMLCGFLVVWLGHPHTNVAVWLPALIVCGEVLVTARRTPIILQSSALLALFVGVQFTGGHIETSVDILFAFGMYYGIRWAQVVLPAALRARTKIGRLLLPTGPIVLGGALAAVQLLPFIEWLPLSAVVQQRAAASFHFINPLFVNHLLSLPVVLFPNLYNNPTWGYSYWSFLFNWANYNELVLYVGTLTLLFAVLSFIKPPPHVKSFLIVWRWLVIVSAGRAFLFPVFDWVNQIPGVNLGSPARLRLITAFSLCVLAGFGAQALFSAPLTDARLLKRIWMRLCGTIVCCGFLLMAVSNLVAPLLKNRIVSTGKQFVAAEYAQRSAQTGRSLEDYDKEIERRAVGFVRAFAPTNIAMYAPLVWAGLGLVLVARSVREDGDRRGTLKGGVLTVVIVDVFTFGYRYNPSLPREQFYPRTALVSALSKDQELFRVLALRQDLIPDAHMMFALADVRGMDFPSRYYDRYLNLVASRVPWVANSALFSSADSALLRVLNIKYVITADPAALRADPHIKSIRKINSMYVGELAQVQPRAFMVYDALPVQNDHEASRLLKQEPEKVFRRVLLSANSQNLRPFFAGQQGSPPANSVSLVASTSQRSQWKVYTSRDGYLFMSDSYYPGWKVYLNGNPIPLYRANLAFRAVFIPEGQHDISFVFEPASLRIGLVLGGGAAAILVGLFGCAYRTGFRHEPKPFAGLFARVTAWCRRQRQGEVTPNRTTE